MKSLSPEELRTVPREERLARRRAFAEAKRPKGLCYVVLTRRTGLALPWLLYTGYLMLTQDVARPLWLDLVGILAPVALCLVAGTGMWMCLGHAAKW